MKKTTMTITIVFIIIILAAITAAIQNNTQTQTTKNNTQTQTNNTIPFGNILFLKGDVKVKVIGGKYYILYFCAESISPTKVSLKKALEDSKGDLTKANIEIVKQISKKNYFLFQAGPFDRKKYEYFLSNFSTGAFELQRDKDTSWAEMNGKKIIVSADPKFIASVDIIKIKTTKMKKLIKRRHEMTSKRIYQEFLRALERNN